MSSEGEDRIRSGSKWSPAADRLDVAVVVMLAMFVVILFVTILVQPESCGPQAPVPTSPCEDQSPPECLVKTIEQASSSQFEHYVYCACVTVEGLSKGYVATSKRPVSTQKLLEISGRDEPH